MAELMPQRLIASLPIYARPSPLLAVTTPVLQYESEKKVFHVAVGVLGLWRRLRVSGLELATATGISNVKLSLWARGYANLAPEILQRVETFLIGELAALQSVEAWRHHRSAFASDDNPPSRPPRKKFKGQGRKRVPCEVTIGTKQK